jgi:hypothetical protein
MKKMSHQNKLPNISNKDLKKLYDYAEKIIDVGSRYGLSTIVSIYAKAYEQIKER